MTKAFVLCALLVVPLASTAQTPGRDGVEPRWRVAGAWRQAQGLPQDSVFTALQTRDGYIWVGTRGGLSRFDGVRFTTFDDRNENQLRENEVWTLAEGDDGSLWIGTYGGGLSRLKNGRFTLYTTQDGLVDDYIRVLVMDRSGALWIGTDHGVSRFKDGRFTNYTVNDGLVHGAVQALYPDRDGSLWIAMRGGGFNRLHEGRVQPGTVAGLGVDARVYAILRDRHGVLWLGQEKGLLRWSEGTATRYTTADGLSSNMVDHLYEDPEGRLWIGTNKGLDRYFGGAVRPITTEISTTATSPIQALLTDREGSLWLGYAGHGLARFRQGLFARYAVEDGLPDDDATTVFQDRSGTVWIGTDRGLSALREGKITTYGAASGLPTEAIGALAQDNEGYLWVGSRTGLFRSRDRAPCTDRSCTARFITVRNDTSPVTRVQVIYPDRQGAIWAGMNLQGLARYEANRFTIYTTRNGLSHDAVRALCGDKKGGLWIGTKGGGLDYFKDGKFTVYREKDGLASDSVQALYLDTDGALWIATRHGLSRFKDGRFTTYTVNDGLHATHGYGFVEDDGGKLWMSCAKGIFWIARQQLNDFAEGKIPSITSVAYGLEHGLASTMGSVARHPVGYKASDGRVWFATASGVVVVDPRALSTNDVPPPVHMEEVSIDRRAFNLDGVAEAAAGRGDFVFRYTALSFLAPEKVRFKYKLEGFERDWTETDTRRVAYTNMPPGRYTFRVKACNNDGVWNERGASFALDLAPHFYQTPWFYALCVPILAGIGWGLVQLRVKGLRAREGELARRVEKRTHELNDQIVERRHAEAALRESEQRYALAVRGTNDGIWDWDLRSNRIHFSARWKEMLGYEEGEIGDSPSEWLDRIHPDDRERLDARIAAHREGLAPQLEDEHRIRHKDGSYRWVLSRGFTVHDAEGHAYRMAGAQTDVTDRRFYDALTGLPNRAMFVEHLARALARSRRRADRLFAVLFLDLDRFKVVNDSQGHLVGDQLLAAIAVRLQGCLRPGDLVARFGGDEFAILADDIEHMGDATRVADRILSDLKAPFSLGSFEAFTSASIGIAIGASSYTRPEELLRDADTAMYRAKANGRGRYEVFDAVMRQRVMALLELESDLRRALARGELRVHYQPVVHLDSGGLVGFEALVRWAHPRRGLVWPEEFIEVAEETGLIIPLGYWMLEQACRQMSEWRPLLPGGTDVVMSVNISARQFADPSLVSEVQRIMEQSRLPPGGLALEITESVIMEKGPAASATLSSLRALDVGLHIDDFGTGYSSLGYLHQFPLDALKVDRSFVAQMTPSGEDTALVRTILTLARSLGLVSIAEGVETADQAARLCALGCDRAQGHYFSAALDTDAMTTLITAGPTWSSPSAEVKR